MMTDILSIVAIAAAIVYISIEIIKTKKGEDSIYNNPEKEFSHLKEISAAGKLRYFSRGRLVGWFVWFVAHENMKTRNAGFDSGDNNRKYKAVSIGLNIFLGFNILFLGMWAIYLLSTPSLSESLLAGVTLFFLPNAVTFIIVSFLLGIGKSYSASVKVQLIPLVHFVLVIAMSLFIF